MSTSPKELWLENQICFPLYAGSRLITKLYTPFLQELDITYPQYLVLLVLWKEDAQTVSQISDKLFLETNTITPLLKRMEQKGLIARVRSTADERKVNIVLTSKGLDLREKAECIPNEIVKQSNKSDVTLEEVMQLKETLNKMLRIWSEAEE
ncbi:MarR family winged helix-turn-helix transcriptional regulator [Phaeocystidibacter marisrubri]|uniref:HTH-type transcriptional regulator SarZ n=1 Tax=Phaeocystidibacter marisrubri TaxID=1577780 RepID=A0A6L3ZDZ9_9FLAO|nr:MarR family transcriptional regulator [Phaeocystidibacter marisrubri]KAB2815846.1 MarR family transcriptional regulator [Phaeocystidibacter marisrubri]GGH66021.1 MarR family transcriptional regulator [Phaeocystidibacter marisrubri]